jgi:hypothetical protein
LPPSEWDIPISIRQGIMPNSSLKKNTITFTGTYNIVDNLKVTTSANYVNTRGKGRNSTGYSDNIMSAFRQWYQVDTDMKLLKDLYDENRHELYMESLKDLIVKETSILLLITGTILIGYVYKIFRLMRETG